MTRQLLVARGWWRRLVGVFSWAVPRVVEALARATPLEYACDLIQMDSARSQTDRTLDLAVR